MTSKSGVYCGPLKLLAVEVFNKCNKRSTPCDLVTGEDRKWATADGEPSSHVSCTVEMTNISQTYEVTAEQGQAVMTPQVAQDSRFRSPEIKSHR